MNDTEWGWGFSRKVFCISIRCLKLEAQRDSSMKLQRKNLMASRARWITITFLECCTNYVHWMLKKFFSLPLEVARRKRRKKRDFPGCFLWTPRMAFSCFISTTIWLINYSFYLSLLVTNPQIFPPFASV